VENERLEQCVSDLNAEVAIKDERIKELENMLNVKNRFQNQEHVENVENVEMGHRLQSFDLDELNELNGKIERLEEQWRMDQMKIAHLRDEICVLRGKVEKEDSDIHNIRVRTPSPSQHSRPRLSLVSNHSDSSQRSSCVTPKFFHRIDESEEYTVHSSFEVESIDHLGYPSTNMLLNIPNIGVLKKRKSGIETKEFKKMLRFWKSLRENKMD